MRYLCLLVFLTACVSTPEKITGAPAGLAITNQTVVTDLQSAAYNLDNAVAVGALPTDDPAPKCLHDVLVKAGIEIPAGAVPAKSFAPKNDGVASAGAIAYILAQQAKQIAKQGIQVDPSCEALVGRVVIDGAKAINKALPLSLIK
jgi:hypothetical protein